MTRACAVIQCASRRRYLPEHIRTRLVIAIEMTLARIAVAARADGAVLACDPSFKSHAHILLVFATTMNEYSIFAAMRVCLQSGQRIRDSKNFDPPMPCAVLDCTGRRRFRDEVLQSPVTPPKVALDVALGA